MKPIYFERGWPYAAAIIVAGVWFYGGRPFPSRPDALMGASGTIAAVFVGFLGTAKAIVLSISNSRVFKKLKETGYSNVLFSYLFEAIAAGILFLIVSTVGFFLKENAQHPWFGFIWILTGAAAVSLYTRTTLILFKLVRQA